MQHQLADRISVNGGYYRRTFGNQTFTDDLRYDANSYDSFCITAPSDPDLPGGGGYQVCGVQDLKPAVFAQNLPANSLIRFSDDFGGETNLYQGFDVNLEARFRNGAFLKARPRRDGAHVRQLQPAQGRASTRWSTAAAAQGTEIYADGIDGCHREYGYRPDVKCRVRTRCRGTSSWPARTSSAAASRPAAPARASSRTWAVTSASAAHDRRARLDRRRVANDRVDSRRLGLRQAQPEPARLKLRSASRVDKVRLRVDFDLYNVFNSSWPYTVSTTYSTRPTAQWQRPTNVLQHRFFKLGANISF